MITFGPAQWTPWLIAENLIATAILVTALVCCWRSADRVVPENRTRTRIWRLFVASLGISIYGVWLPIGAVYSLMAYTPYSRYADGPGASTNHVLPIALKVRPLR